MKRLFQAATELDEQEVAAFLAAACPGDGALRAEVESLLAHHRLTTLMAENSLEAVPGQIIPPVPPPEEELTLTGATHTLSPRPQHVHAAAETERFAPGTVVAGRYRVYGLLGRGGMGEVFRADDLRLQQPVALKFMARSRSADEVWLARFHNEVRLARRVTHPNVNRVYDIGEADGEVFLSMEYVDGEDLAGLLRRVGCLPGERALRMARELCAGLGAAHDQGVLHRDLKPANVMIDALGHVRIMDFGIAVAKSDADAIAPAGTPAYMAPELFDGAEPSVATDIYALGIVLYELVTGQSPFDRAGRPGKSRSRTPRPPSEVTGHVDPRLEQVILQCLAPHPRDRPHSTYDVLAALPGGDALAAAVATGQTPSPDMVAAAAERPADRRATISLAVAALVGLAAVFALADWTMFVPQAGLEKPPVVLADRAAELLDRLGYESEQGRVSGFAIDQGYLQYVAEHPQAAEEDLPSVFFWYRQGDQRLAPPSPLSSGTSPRRLPPVEGINQVHLDAQGRLLRLAIYHRTENWIAPENASESVDWSRAFEAAGLDPLDYEATTPQAPPPMYADEVIAWQRRDTAGPDLPRRIEAAAEAGRVVFFDVVLPWENAAGDAASHLLSTTAPPAFVALFWLRAATLLAAIVLAQRNLRMRRGDLVAARRLALFVFALAMLDWILGERHVAVFREEAAAALLWTARATFIAAATWCTYVAVEPYVRRLWPRTIITWSRLIAGRFRDPLVGRDLLVGAVLGIALTWVRQIDILLGRLVGVGSGIAKLPGTGCDLGELLGLRYKLGTIVSLGLDAVTFGMFLLLMLLLLRIAFRSERWGAIAFCAMFTAVAGFWANVDTAMPWLLGLITGLAIVFVLTRVGFVAVAVGLFVKAMLTANPITLDFSAWYAPSAVFAAAVVAAIAGFGFYSASAGRRPG